MHTFNHPSGSTAAIMATPRENRLSSENRRIKQNFATLVEASPHLVALGPDPLVDQLLAANAFDPREAFSVRLLISSSSIWDATRVQSTTAILVSTRAWHRGLDRVLLSQVKRQAMEERVRCILVPQRALAGGIRLSTAKLIAGSRHVRFSATDRLRIIAHVQQEGWSTLSDCAGQIYRHQDPVGVVLALVAKGDLSINRAQPIGPHSRIDTNH